MGRILNMAKIYAVPSLEKLLKRAIDQFHKGKIHFPPSYTKMFIFRAPYPYPRLAIDASNASGKS